MVVPYEREMQEQLVNHLGLLERDLRCVATEYPLPNSEGTRGRIDILARDGHGSWVVIELKRADATARQALHEVTKYTELLQREKGLPAQRVRAIIASTSWNELLVPVSNLARDWSHDLRGYRLVLEPDGAIASAEPIELLPAPTTPEVTPIQFMYFFDTVHERDQGWQQVVNRAARAGAHDLLAANIRRVRDIEQVQAPLGLYFALGRMDPAATPPRIRTAAADREEAPGYELEYEALCHITKHVSGAAFEDVGPGVLRQLAEDPRWTIEGYRTAGSFGKRSPLSAHDLLRDLNGDNGGIGHVRYTGSARTTNRGRWPAFLTEYSRSLSHNEDWSVLVRQWLDDVASAPEESDVVLDIYNPCDLITTLVHGWPQDLEKFTPTLLGITRTASGSHRVIRGTLYWNGNPVPNLAERVRAIYRDPMAWVAACTYGDNRVRDTLLIALLELRYVFIEHVTEGPTPPSADNAVAMWVISDDNSPRRVEAPFTELRQEGWNGAYTMDTFLEEHRDQVDTLVNTYRNELSFWPPGSTETETGLDLEKYLDDRAAIVSHTIPDDTMPEPAVTDLPDCTQPARERVPDEDVADALTTIARLDNPAFQRRMAIYICAMQGGGAATAATWLLDTLSTLHPRRDVIPHDTGVPALDNATRSDYIVGTCYLVSLDSLSTKIRCRAADRLVAFCQEAGYLEARRLMPAEDFSWLPSTLRTENWGWLLASYVLNDESISNSTRESIEEAVDQKLLDQKPK